MTSTICDDGVTSVSGRIHFRPAAERTRRQLARRRLHRPIRKLKSTRCRLNDAVDDEPIRHSDEAGGDIYVERSQPIPDAILVARGGEQEVQISALEDARPQISLSQAPETAQMRAMPLGGQFVASRTGTVYYYPWCGGAQQIPVGAQLWFNSENAAQNAGYALAKNCRGL